MRWTCLTDLDVPVVFTGAMRNASLPGADGPANLLAAIRVAASPQARGLGVVVVFSDEIHAARHVRKGHSTSTATFGSPLTGPLGHVTEDRVRILLRPAGRFHVPLQADVPDMRVAQTTTFFDDDGRLVEAVPDLGYQGLVVAAFGGGHVPQWLVPILAKVASRVPVVLASRTNSGEMLRSSYGYPGSETDLLAHGLISASSIDAAHATVLLRLLLMARVDSAALSWCFEQASHPSGRRPRRWRGEVAMTALAGGEVNLTAVEARAIGLEDKAFPVTSAPVRISEVGVQGWNALKPPFATPVMVIRDSALTHNIDLMAEYCAAQGVSLAPHVKTPLSPQIAARQLAAGAWGLTVADVRQAAVMLGIGARRLILANEVVDAASAEWLARLLTADPGADRYCLIDSIAGARLLDGCLASTQPASPLRVLIELGLPGGRCGCRTVGEAVSLAREVAGLRWLTLAGVEAYEGMFPHSADSETTNAIGSFFDDLSSLTTQLDSAGLLDGEEEILVTAGGSLWPDYVVAALGRDWAASRPVRTVLRSGQMESLHDHGEMDRLSPLAGRSLNGQHLRPALELWGTVISRPEPGLAILNVGKRDTSTDRGLPVPFAVVPRDGAPNRLQPAGAELLSLNDHHARVAVPSSSALTVGDRSAATSPTRAPRSSAGDWSRSSTTTTTYSGQRRRSCEEVDT